MGSKTYHPIHSHVMVRAPSDLKVEDRHELEEWRMPCAIVHVTGDRVWISASCWLAKHDEIKPVSDGVGSDTDMDGNRIVSIPAEWCTFYDEDEAEGIMRCIEADDFLLACAKG